MELTETCFTQFSRIGRTNRRQRGKVVGAGLFALRDRDVSTDLELQINLDVEITVLNALIQQLAVNSQAEPRVGTPPTLRKQFNAFFVFY